MCVCGGGGITHQACKTEIAAMNLVCLGFNGAWCSAQPYVLYSL